MFEPKIPAIGASIGFVLSFIIGVLNGISFGTVLFRAIIMGVLFGGLVIITRIMIIRFIPDLMEAQSSDSGEEFSSGNIVDITIDESGKEDNPFESAGSPSGSSNKMVPDFLESSVQNDSGSFLGSTEQPVASFQPLQPGIQSTVLPTVTESTQNKAVKSKSVGGLDVLPDLQDFIPKESVLTSSDSDYSEAVTEGTGLRESSFATADVSSSSVEAETMAKAIRTILAKEN